jgi:hypothetical protein
MTVIAILLLEPAGSSESVSLIKKYGGTLSLCSGTLRMVKPRFAAVGISNSLVLAGVKNPPELRLTAVTVQRIAAPSKVTPRAASQYTDQ